MKSSAPTPRDNSKGIAVVLASPKRLSSWMFWLAIFVLVAGVFALYSPALDFDFIIDDPNYVGDPRVQSSGHVWEYFTNYVWAQTVGGEPSFYRPIFVLWLRINFIFNGMSPWGWHLFSIGKHALVALLLGLLVWKLVRDRVAALTAATLFALHPSHTESVAWITVPDPLLASALLASVLFLLKYLESIPGFGQPLDAKSGKKPRKAHRVEKPSIMWLILSVVCCLAALLTKETAVILPPILFLTLVVLHPTPQDSTQGQQRLASFLSRFVFAFRYTALFFCMLILYFLLRLNAFRGSLGSASQHLPLTTLLVSIPGILWFYVKVVFWPFRSWAFGNTDKIGVFSVQTFFLPATGVCVFVALLVWLLFVSWKRAQRLERPDRFRIQLALTLGTLLFTFPILLVLNLNRLNPGDFLHGRYVYLSLIGFMLLLAAVWRLFPACQRFVIPLAGLLAVAFAALTISQEEMWKDNLTVYTVGNQIAPHNRIVGRNLARARIQVALKLGDSGRCSEGLPVFEEGTRQFPDDWIPWAALGDCYYQLNDLPKAEAYLHRAADLAHLPRVTEQWEHVRSEMQNSGQR